MITIILLLQANVAIQASQLMRSGDVERNPGPGRYSGECVETVVDGGGTFSMSVEVSSSQSVLKYFLLLFTLESSNCLFVCLTKG